MKIASLEAYGTHRDLLAAWTHYYDKELLPIQERAILEGGVLNGTSIVGSGPTGCGKTLIAEMAATHAASKGRRTVYLVPTKALASAVFEQFLKLYAPLGLRIVISTQDHRNSDRKIVRGEFDILITVPEKLWAMLLNSPALGQSIGTMVADELQTLGEPDRGPCLELLMSFFAAQPQTQIVGISAVLGNGREIADWLGARLVEERQRPVELHKGVWCDGTFRYVAHNSGNFNIEDMPVKLPEDSAGLDAIVALATALANREEATLVFLRDRHSAVTGARMATRDIEAPSATHALDALRELPRAVAGHALQELMSCGVAFHNADLHFAERSIIEKAFIDGEIRCLFATSTLAVGLNLPATNVIIEPLRWQAVAGTPALTPLGQGEFENMAGRAGRLGFGDEFGRAILVSSAEYDADQLTKRYILTTPEPVTSKLSQLPAVERLVLTAALMQDAPQELHTLEGEGASLTASTIPVQELALAQSLGLITQSKLDGAISLTGLGRAAASCGIPLRTVHDMICQLQKLGRVPTDIEALALAAITSEARNIPLPRGNSQQRYHDLLPQLSAQYGNLSEVAQAWLNTPLLSSGDRELAMRLVCLAIQWTLPETTSDLEETTGIPVGRAAVLGATLGWLIQCQARLSRELGHNGPELDRLDHLGETLSLCLPVECLSLSRLHLAKMQRDHYLAIYFEGLKTREKLFAASDEQLLPLIPAQVITGLRTMQQMQERQERKNSQPEKWQLKKPEEKIIQSALLVVDQSRPDRALVNGFEILLRPLEFKMLRVLSETPRRCVSYNRIYNTLWGDKEAVEPQQIYWHRLQLTKKINKVLPENFGEILRTLPKRGLMLDLPPDQVLAT